jgi:hypothetical protein
LPSGLSPEQRTALADTITWLRNNDPRLEDVDEDSLKALANFADIQLPRAEIPAKDRSRIVETALSWIRENCP